MAQKFRSKTDDELGIHILEDIAAELLADKTGRVSNNLTQAFAGIGADIQQIDTLLALDSSQGKAMHASRGVAVSISPKDSKEVEWLVRAFRDPVRIGKLTFDSTIPFSSAYVVEVATALSKIRVLLEATAEGGGEADLACNRGLRQYHLKSLKLLSHDLDFELVYNVVANSNLSGDPTKPDWHELIDNGTKPPRKPPHGSGPNNGGTPKGALVPFPQQMTVAVAA
jgi:hypothetical protein